MRLSHLYDSQEDEILSIAIEEAWEEDWVDWQSDDIPPEINGTDEQEEYVREKILRPQVNAVREKIEMAGPYLFRAVTAPSVEEIRLDPVGPFWAWDIKAAHPHGDSNWNARSDPVFILEAEIDPSSWDMETSVALNLLPTRREEREIRVRRGEPAKIVKIHTAVHGGGSVVGPFNENSKMTTQVVNIQATT